MKGYWVQAIVGVALIIFLTVILATIFPEVRETITGFLTVIFGG